MAKGRVTCTCEKCGAEFEVTATKQNRRDADQWESWAKDFYTECKACYAAEMKEIEDRKYAELGLPEIEAVSEKQKAFADSLRKRYAVKNIDDIKKVRELLENITEERIKEAAEKLGIEESEVLIAAMRESYLEKEYVCVTETSAKKIIDTLKTY